jgi:hypothetical protein
VLAALEAGYEDAERQVFLRTRDISESGVFLWAPDPPQVGASAQLLLQLPGEPVLLRLHGSVIRREDREPRGFALRFAEDLGPSALGPLREWLARAATSTGPQGGT